MVEPARAEPKGLPHSLVVGLVHDAPFLRDPCIGSRVANAHERLESYYMRKSAQVQ